MDELINSIITLITNAGLSLSDAFEVGQLPTDGGLRIQVGAGTTNKTWLDKGNESTIPLVAFAKNINQLTAIQDLDKTSRYLEGLKVYPDPGNGIEIVDIMINPRPQYIDKEDNGQYIYSMVLNVKISQ